MFLFSFFLLSPFFSTFWRRKKKKFFHAMTTTTTSTFVLHTSHFQATELASYIRSPTTSTKGWLRKLPCWPDWLDDWLSRVSLCWSLSLSLCRRFSESFRVTPDGEKYGLGRRKRKILWISAGKLPQKTWRSLRFSALTLSDKNWKLGRQEEANWAKQRGDSMEKGISSVAGKTFPVWMKIPLFFASSAVGNLSSKTIWGFLIG